MLLSLFRKLFSAKRATYLLIPSDGSQGKETMMISNYNAYLSDLSLEEVIKLSVFFECKFPNVSWDLLRIKTSLKLREVEFVKAEFVKTFSMIGVAKNYFDEYADDDAFLRITGAKYYFTRPIK